MVYLLSPPCNVNDYLQCYVLKYNVNVISYVRLCFLQLKSSDAKASKCHLQFSSRMIIFIKLVFKFSNFT